MKLVHILPGALEAILELIWKTKTFLNSLFHQSAWLAGLGVQPSLAWLARPAQLTKRGVLTVETAVVWIQSGVGVRGGGWQDISIATGSCGGHGLAAWLADLIGLAGLAG